MAIDPRTELEDKGRLWMRRSLSQSDLSALEKAADAPSRPGARLNWSSIFEERLGARSKMAELVQSVMPDSFPVRLVTFDKTPESNWSVPWHQDRVVAVAERHETAGFRNWSQKAGTWHAEPPIELLEHMLFARIHLDDADQSNGCLELALGTHKLGLVVAEQAAAFATLAPREICRAERGDVLLVKALTLHRSLSSKSKSSRRALRVDFANRVLPPPLQWSISLPA